ncbi:MAG: GAF domain-containing protein [Verrucomicrobiota bacterium]
MIKAQPTNEKRRLEVLWQYDVMDSVPESSFDDLTELAAEICGAPMATITLIDEHRQWFKSKIGLSASETSRDISFCAHTMQGEDLMIVPDATKDERFATNPLVTGAPNIRFYAGAPLINPDGVPLGSLCVLDSTPRELNPAQKRALKILARQVMALLELRRKTLQQKKQDRSENNRLAQDHRAAALSQLGQRLSAAVSAREAALVIGDIASELFGWDMFLLNLISLSNGTVVPVLNMDTIGGKRGEVFNDKVGKKSSPLATRIMQNGGELILKREPLTMLPEAIPTGDVSRPSASLMFVPLRNGKSVIGILSIQSYSLNAYAKEDLEALQAMADHCGGALERIQTQEALRRSEMRFHSVWENSVDGMRLTDEDGIIVAVNRAFCNLVEMEPADLEGKPFSVIYAKELEHTALLEKYRQRFRDRTVEKFMERRVTLHSGKSVELEGTNSFVDLEGERPFLLGLFRDVTEKHQLQDQLRQSQKMESVGLLAGGIAHDFNNLLTVIHGHAALLLATEQKGEFSESLQQISLAAERSANLTRQLLTFSRRQVMQRRSLDLKEVVDEMTKMLRRILGEDIVLKLENNSRLPFVNADRGMMEQILMNLAVNSRDAMPRGGTLTISTQTVGVDEAHTRRNHEAYLGEFVCLHVSDTGSGIAPENLDHIFEPFFTTKETGKGTGLGLATVYGIVQQHDGWIEVSSKAGEGTTFRVFLPGTSESEKKGSLARVEKAPRGDETILIVEDEKPLRELVQFILERQGYRVLEADSGVTAMKIWETDKDQISLLLTDLVMPEGMNGIELSLRLLADKPDLKVIFTSGYSTAIAGKDLVLHEGLNFLQKPYHPDKLAQTVRGCLDGK